MASWPRERYARADAGPLRGVRILDLTRLVSGAQLAVLLGDLGADVIKVERPGVGDPFRHAGGSDAHWRAYARNKRSITLDLTKPRGRKLLLELASRSDILAENFAPGGLERYCGGPDALLERNPKLVIVCISGWGQTGPLHPAPLSLADAVPVYDILEDEHYRARETVVEMEDDGTVLANVVPHLSGTPGAIRLPAPALGEHNAEVYGELGLDIAELEREGVV